MGHNKPISYSNIGILCLVFGILSASAALYVDYVHGSDYPIVEVITTFITVLQLRL